VKGRGHSYKAEHVRDISRHRLGHESTYGKQRKVIFMRVTLQCFGVCLWSLCSLQPLRQSPRRTLHRSVFVHFILMLYMSTILHLQSVIC